MTGVQGKRPTAVEKETAAECRGCAWKLTGTGALGNAARHHDASGHVVDVCVGTRITYGDPAAVPAGQAQLDDVGEAPDGYE